MHRRTFPLVSWSFTKQGEQYIGHCLDLAFWVFCFGAGGQIQGWCMIGQLHGWCLAPVSSRVPFLLLEGGDSTVSYSHWENWTICCAQSGYHACLTGDTKNSSFLNPRESTYQTCLLKQPVQASEFLPTLWFLYVHCFGEKKKPTSFFLPKQLSYKTLITQRIYYYV